MGAFVALYNAAGFRLTGEPLNLSPAIASLVFVSYALGSVSSATANRLSARIGRRQALVGVLVLTAVGALLTIPDSLPLIVVGFLVLTTAFFAAHSIANSWAAADAPENARGQVGGLYMLMYYLGSSVGGGVGSVVYGRAGWSWLIVAVVVWLGLAVTVVAVGTRARREARVLVGS